MTSRRSKLWAALALSTTFAVAAGAQKPLRGDEPVPAGHLQVDRGAAPSASSPHAAGAPTPPAHEERREPAEPDPHEGPAERAPGANPHGDERQQPRDVSASSATVPAGSIEVVIRDALEKPLTEKPIRLGILRQTIAEGEARGERQSRTDAEGRARFDGLPVGSDHSYRVTVMEGIATYATPPITLGRETGHAVVLHVYPVVRDINRALIGARGFLQVEPRDDVFQFEVMFQIFNIGEVTWVPENLVLRLPEGHKGFTAQESMDDTRFVSTPEGVRLEGTFSPGQRDASFRFQVPNDHDETKTFSVAILPHVAEMRVVSQNARGMQLLVEGFEAAQNVTAQNGERLLLAARQLRQGESEMRDLVITLRGIPTPGPGRWIAALVAAGVALAGIGTAARGTSVNAGRAGASGRSDAAQARDVLLGELADLERAHHAERVGPRTYEAARRALFDALTRIEEALESARVRGQKSETAKG